MTARARPLVDPGRLRLLAYVAATVGALIAMVGPYVYNDDRTWVWVTAFVPIIVLVSLSDRRIRATVLGLGGGFIALWTPDAVYLWTLVSALVLVSIVEDRREVPLTAWVAGLVGSVGSLVLYPDSITIASFLAVGLGGAIGLLVRSQFETAELTERADQLRGQTQWLEQRTLLARELHDVVGHHVTAMVVQAEAGLVGDPTRALGSIGDLGRSALSELDALVGHLRDPAVPLTLSAPPRLADVDELLAAPLRQQGVEVHVRIDPMLDLDEVLTLTVYRIFQEALTNVARHARAATTWVELRRVSQQLRLRVTDDGVGPPAEVTRGSGLIGIEERARGAGGIWAISDRPGGGTVIDVFLPLGPVRRG